MENSDQHHHNDVDKQRELVKGEKEETSEEVKASTDEMQTTKGVKSPTDGKQTPGEVKTSTGGMQTPGEVKTSTDEMQPTEVVKSPTDEMQTPGEVKSSTVKMQTTKGVKTSTDEKQTTKDKNVSTSDVDEATTSSGSNGTKSIEIIRTISEKSLTVCRKLQMRFDGLQKRQQIVEGSNKAAFDNDLKASKVLHAMRTSKLTKTSVPNDPTSSLNRSCTENGPVVAAAAAFPPLHGHSKLQLEALVVGLQELVSKLTMNDKSLKSKAQHLAVNIRSLQKFPLFVTDVDNLPSTSQRVGTRSNGEEVKIQENTISSTSKKSNKQEKRTSELTPQDKLLNYINSMLLEYLGQCDKLEKLKCNPNHLEDLENYAQTLVQSGLGRVVEEEIRVNRKNNRQAFITLGNGPEGLDRDGIVTLPVARRYAFDGDITRAFVMLPIASSQNNDEGGKKTRRISQNIMGGKDNSICLADDEDLSDECDSSHDTDMEDIPNMCDPTTVVSPNCPKAFVISIVRQTELREVVGSISFKKTTSLNSRNYYKLKPHDMRVPMLYIAADSCEDQVNTVGKDDIIGMLYLARVLETDHNGYCIGELLQPVGKVGNLEAEIKAILLHNGMKNLKPYDQKFYDMYDGPMLPVSEEDLKHREDLRKKCIFTIDPLTARDLDDAVSVEKISDEEYEIGVHISDVSHYLEENSELDSLVKERATSIYLVNEVIHMLPTSLCFRCSLLPGEDKFAFSVFWRWNIKTRVMEKPRFTRSVINSCSQFAYEHAQKIIDNPEENFGSEDFPEIYNNWTPSDIQWRVLLLYSISQTLKAQRYESGAISINNPKLRFTLDPELGEPVSYTVDGQQEANFLIEEFMLLANQAVAKFIHRHFPDTSILRNHAPPISKSMKALKERLANLNLDFDISTSKTIFESMQRLCSQASDPAAMDACLSSLLTKPMCRARYYCSEGKSEESEFWHYALSIPIYTHFTSPIRRYPDILVHRLLAAALNYCKPPQRTADELHQLAKICNDQKFNAKNAGDESSNLFFVRYIRLKESITLNAVVTDIFRHMLNVVTIETGHTFTVQYKLQKVFIDATHVPSYVLVSEKNSQRAPVKLQLFSSVVIKVVLRNNNTCAFLESPDKTQRRINSKESSKLREKQINNNSNSNNTANGLRPNNNSISEHEESTENPSKKSRRSRKDRKKDRIYAVKADD